MNKTHTSTNNANKLAIKMATALIIGLIAGTSFIFLREKLISSGNSDTWTMINNLLFQDITKPEANNAIGIFYIGLSTIYKLTAISNSTYGIYINNSCYV